MEICLSCTPREDRDSTKKRIIRIVCGPILPHYLKEVEMLTIKEVFYHSVGVFMYKYVNKRLPDVFNKMYQYTSNIHHRDNLYLTLRTPKCKQLEVNTINYYGAKIWNTIIQEINVNYAIGTFKNAPSSQFSLLYHYYPITPN